MYVRHSHRGFFTGVKNYLHLYTVVVHKDLQVPKDFHTGQWIALLFVIRTSTDCKTLSPGSEGAMFACLQGYMYIYICVLLYIYVWY